MIPLITFVPFFHGFKRAIARKANAPKTDALKGMEIIAVELLSEALEAGSS